MKIAVLGMGGIGGVVGASLAKKFDDIYFIYCSALPSGSIITQLFSSSEKI